LGSALLAISSSAADPIGGASYKGPGRGDVDKTEFTVSHDGKVIGSMSVGFDSRCRQGGNDYTNKNTSTVFYKTKIRGSGKFKARDKRSYPGGGDLSVAKGRFSADGKSAKGRFTFEGDFDPSSGPTVHCHAEGRFRATTKAKPDDGGGGGSGGQRAGTWTGTTGQGMEIIFDVEDGGERISGVLFQARLDCTRDDPSLGPTSFTTDYEGHIQSGRIDGSSFSGSQDANRVSGRFDGETATGVISVTNYYDELELATCSTPGDVPFTAKLDRG
jgi:hypothetical protein